ncbi:MAG: PEP-CTERM sorting domain-containing protein [Chthoniobacter sp.]|nr:PEP-CTERM sorting domain-containing protein [Chthoniobacter sp.]
MPCLALTLLGLGSARSDAATQVIAVKGDTAPGLGTSYTSFTDPVLNGSGVVAFIGNTGTGAAVYKTSSGGLVTIAKSGDSAPLIGSVFTDFSGTLLNESGMVAFFGSNDVLVTGAVSFTKTGLYTGTGGSLISIAATGEAAPTLTGNGTTLGITVFGSAGIGDNGGVVFKASAWNETSSTVPTAIYTGTGGSTATTLNATTITSTTQAPPDIVGTTFSTLSNVVYNNLGASLFTGTYSTSSTGIYSGFGGALTTIATSAQAVPVVGGTFASFVNPVLNDQGTAAFVGNSSIAGSSGIFTGSGGALSVVVTTGQVVPSPLSGTFTAFPEFLISNSGSVAFQGFTSTGGKGVFISSGGSLQSIASTAQTAPTIGGNFTAFSKIAINDIGLVAFIATSSSGSARGLYLSDGQETITAAYGGMSVAGGTITSTSSGILLAGGADRGGSSQFNNNGQIAYRATLTGAGITPANNSAVLLFTPTLHFRNAAGGSWSTRNNWTVGILPASVHDVVIAPAAALAVNGPLLPTTVSSLAIGTSTGLAELALQSSGTITAPGGVSTGGMGKLRGNGKLVANLTSAGIIAPGLPSSAGSVTVMGNVTLQATSHLALDLGGLVQKTGYDFLSVSGTFSLGGNLDITLLGGFSPLLGHTFDLFDAASTTGSFAALNLPALSAGLGWNTSLLASTGVISVVSTGRVNATWNIAGGGSWSAALASNWNPAIPDGNGTVANFSTAITGNSTVSVDTAKTVGKITFNNANSYTVAGTATDTITLADSTATPQINVTLGSHTISAPLILSQNTSVGNAAGTTLTISGGITGAGQSLTKTGTGTLNLDGLQSYAALNATAGATTVDGAVGSGAAVVSATGTGTTLKFGTVSQTLASLTIGAGAKVTFTSGAASFGGSAGKASGLAGGAVVPEPGSLGLLLTGLLGFLARRPRAAR